MAQINYSSWKHKHGLSVRKLSLRFRWFYDVFDHKMKTKRIKAKLLAKRGKLRMAFMVSFNAVTWIELSPFEMHTSLRGHTHIRIPNGQNGTLSCVEINVYCHCSLGLMEPWHFQFASNQWFKPFSLTKSRASFVCRFGTCSEWQEPKEFGNSQGTFYCILTTGEQHTRQCGRVAKVHWRPTWKERVLASYVPNNTFMGLFAWRQLLPP